jgi:ABC-type multidrug transport system permease subunit
MNKVLSNITLVAMALMLQSIVVYSQGWGLFSGICLLCIAVVYGIAIDTNSFLKLWK